ncbi:hypothetical protein ACIRN4_15895 [Pimelobacter simplex]|uniref:hypothetical protein n=1 Tax=Nocardioides simplex TaxID=2045 RepID=UPI0038026D37
MNTHSMFRRVAVLVGAFGLALLLMAPSARASVAAEPTASPAPVPQRVDCDKWRSAVAGLTKWAKSKSKSTCSYMSAQSPVSKPAFKGFAWSIPPGSNGRICVQARGYGWDNKAKKTTVKWYSLGCGTSGSGKVPWHSARITYKGKAYYGGAAAMPEVRAKVQPGFLGAAYAWRQ